MKAWTVTFNGHYPVGACAVIVADDVETAAQIIYAELDYRGLKQVIPWENFKELPLDRPFTRVILDGEY